MTPARIHKLSLLAVALWCLHCGTLIVLAVTPEVEAVSRVAEVAREKDVVWLSLATAIAAIAFSAWLVRQLVALQFQATAAVDKLRLELEGRPCAYLRDPQPTPNRHHP